MKRTLKILSLMLAVPLLIAATVTASEYVTMYHYYGRSDGLFQRTDSKGIDAVINGYRLNSITKAVYEDFTEYGDGDVVEIGAGGGCLQTDLTTTAANQGDVDLCQMPSGNVLAAFQLTAQTAGIDMDAGSLDISGDQVNNEGLEIAWGAYGASGGAFIVGTDPAFYTCATVTVADADGADEFWIGFRSVEAFNATWNNYSTYAAIGPAGGNITIESELGGASAASTDTTEDLSNGGTDTYCVYVSAAGVVTYTIDGHPPATTAAVTLTDAVSVIPMIHILQDTGLTEEIDLTEWEVGYATAPF